jgi:hypothetical protein
MVVIVINRKVINNVILFCTIYCQYVVIGTIFCKHGILYICQKLLIIIYIKDYYIIIYNQ